MKKLEEQINWVANEITTQNIQAVLSSVEFNIPLCYCLNKDKHDYLTSILKSLELLLEKPNILQCENCVLRDLPF